MSVSATRKLLLLALGGLLAGCGGGGGSDGGTLDIASAGFEDASAWNGASFSVDLDNRTGEQLEDVAIEVRLVQGIRDMELYTEKVKGCGDSDGQILPGACHQTGSIVLMDYFGYDSTLPAVARFRLYDEGTSVDYDVVEQTVAVW